MITTWSQWWSSTAWCCLRIWISSRSRLLDHWTLMQLGRYILVLKSNQINAATYRDTHTHSEAHTHTHKLTLCEFSQWPWELSKVIKTIVSICGRCLPRWPPSAVLKTQLLHNKYWSLETEGCDFIFPFGIFKLYQSLGGFQMSCFNSPGSLFKHRRWHNQTRSNIINFLRCYVTKLHSS